jgi:uncharacterized protein YbjT (DUF2867 family)
VKVLIAGATGFIGASLAAALRARGHQAVALGRREADFSVALRPEELAPRLAGIDVVVNAVGILRSRGRQSFEALHYAAPRALFRACEIAGVRRALQVSALGADESARSRFHLSKRRSDEYLASLALDWVIVRPSLVFGARGASARLLAALASLPWIPLPGDGSQRVQPIHIDDLTQLLVYLVEGAASRTIIPAVGPRPVTLREWLAELRAQMHLGPARFLRIPLPLVPLDRETLGMLLRGNTASPDRITAILGRPPREIANFVKDGDALALRARLGWLLPMLRASLALVWIASGVVSLGLYPLADSLAMLARVGLTGTLAKTALVGAASLDIAFGLATLLAKHRRWLWRAQFALIAAYSVIVALKLPELWLHPFGPLLKNLPMLAALVLLHELEERR